MRRIVSGFLLLVGLMSSASLGWCDSPDEGWKAVGIRAGIPATSKRENLYQYEAYTIYGLPWAFRADSGWGVAFQLNAAVGVLHGAGETGVIGSLGPGVVFDKGGKGVAFDLGGDLCFLGRHKFGAMDLNGDPMFEGHVGLTYRFESGLGVSYRFQHMSNGGLGLAGNGNPGLDLHMLGLSWNL